jgi:hypothetical protein
VRRLLADVGAAALICGPTVLAFFSGGFFDSPRIIAAIAACSLVVLAALVAPQPLPVSTAGRLALGGLALLCVWTALSISWAPLGARAVDDLQRLMLYLAFFVASAALLGGDGVRRRLEPLLVLGAFVIVAYALSERLLPDLVELSRSRSSSGRLEQPISYWNGLGALLAIGFVLAVRVAGDVGRPRLLRAAAAVAGVWLGLGVYLSFSRGALAAAGAGLLVVLALAPGGRASLRAAVTITVCAALAAAVATRFDSITSLELGEKGDAGDGFQMLAVLVLLSVAAALITPRPPRMRMPAPSLGVSRPVAVLSATLVVALAGAVTVAVLEGKPEGTSPVPGADAERLGSIDTNRYRYWEVALDAWADKPLTGVGSGGFKVRWLRERDRVDASGEAHSLYVETAAELGLVGLAFLVMWLAGTAAAVVRLHRRDPSAGAGVAAGLTVWALHASLDWDWEIPAVTMPALLLAAAAIAWSEADTPTGVAEGSRASARNLGMRIASFPLVLVLSLALAAVAAVAPATVLAQSAGDEQYVDPFQNDQGGGGQNGGGGGGGGGGSGAQGTQGGGDAGAPTTTAPTQPETGTADGSAPVVPSQTTAGQGATLPRTGLPAIGLAAIGAMLLGGGAALRRRA